MALEYMPLAIVQAAAYMKQKGPRFAVSWYLEDFQKSDSKRIAFLGNESGHRRRDWQAIYAILLTWEIYFHYIKQMRQLAADFLSLMSFFDRQGIPDSPLRDGKDTRDNNRSLPTQDKDNTDDDSDDEESPSESIVAETFEGDIFVLRDYSLISISGDEKTLKCIDWCIWPRKSG
jgi:hypothetical protein